MKLRLINLIFYCVCAHLKPNLFSKAKIQPLLHGSLQSKYLDGKNRGPSVDSDIMSVPGWTLYLSTINEDVCFWQAIIDGKQSWSRARVDWCTTDESPTC